jgi:acyl-CoA dehydrogenase
MSELGELFEDVAERIFSDHVTQELIESAERGEWPAALWNAVEEAGLTRALLSEEAGGAGARWSDLYPILMTAGRHAAPIPLAEALLGTWLLGRAGLEVPSGPLSMVPHAMEEGTITGDGLTTRLKARSLGTEREHLVFVAPAAKQACVGLLKVEGVILEQRENIAREPRDEVKLAGAANGFREGISWMPAPFGGLYGAMVRTAQMTGALEALLEMSVAYANERVQFGKPIGKFQAIQQELARLAGEVAASGMAAKAAFHAADRAWADPDFDPMFEIAAAKIRLGDAADLAPGIAHQTHGAIGFTYEHRLHFFTRRLWSWRAEFGTAAEWADRLGPWRLSKGADGLWPWITRR